MCGARKGIALLTAPGEAGARLRHQAHREAVRLRGRQFPAQRFGYVQRKRRHTAPELREHRLGCAPQFACDGLPLRHHHPAGDPVLYLSNPSGIDHRNRGEIIGTINQLNGLQLAAEPNTRA